MTGPGTSPYPNWPQQNPRKSHKVRNVTLMVLGGFVALAVIAGVAGGGAKNKNSGQAADNSVVNAGDAGRPAGTKAPAAAAVAPKTLLDAKGDGIKKTGTFAVTRPWKLAYSFDCAGFGGKGNFQVMLYDGTSLADILTNDLAASGNTTTNAYTTGGALHLEINSECSWHVRVIG
jgi:hypothetical protein